MVKSTGDKKRERETCLRTRRSKGKRNCLQKKTRRGKTMGKTIQSRVSRQRKSKKGSLKKFKKLGNAGGRENNGRG